ncbi:MAG: proline dehydrogenase family protein [Planctomycetota bacterium]
MSIFDRPLAALLPFVPRFIVGRVSRAYIAGATLDSAIGRVRDLNDLGAGATLDLLGEELHEADQWRATAAGYREAIAAIAAAGVKSGVSLKLTAFGLMKDPALTKELVTEILVDARAAGRFVRLDMEDATTTDATLDLYRELRSDGFDNVGVVLQTCLRRTLDDARALAAVKADVRVVKGIYIEPEEISWRDPQVIRENYVRVVRTLLAAGCRVAAATHDEVLVHETRIAMEELGVDREMVEFQMLLGVREELRDGILANGFRMRVYVPYGEKWYEYSMRRLRENPAMAGHITRAMLGRMFSRRRKT